MQPEFENSFVGKSYQYLTKRTSLKERERRFKIFKIPIDRIILDYGCGNGLDLLAFEKLGYMNVIGLDRSGHLLSHINNRFNIIQADVYNTGLKTESVEVVFVNSVLHHLEYPQTALMEIKRILVPGGELYLIEPANNMRRKFLDWVTLSTFVPRFSAFIDIRRAGLLKDDYQLYRRWLESESKFRTLLKSLGFEIKMYRKKKLSLFVKSALSGFNFYRR